MKQLTLTHQAEFQRYAKKTCRKQFLEEMNAVMPWAELLALVEPHYSKGEVGCKPVDLEMRLYFLRQRLALSDPGIEDALYESAGMCRSAGIDLERASALDETTILNFHHLLEARELCGEMLDMVGQPLSGEPRYPHHDRHHWRCHHHSCALVDQERDAGARPGDASDKEGQSVVCVTNTSGSSGCCIEDGSRPPGAGLQEQVSNRLMLLRSKGVVVSD